MTNAAAKALGKLSWEKAGLTPARLAACKANAKRPRPGRRKKIEPDMKKGLEPTIH